MFPNELFGSMFAGIPRGDRGTGTRAYSLPSCSHPPQFCPGVFAPIRSSARTRFRVSKRKSPSLHSARAGCVTFLIVPCVSTSRCRPTRLWSRPARGGMVRHNPALVTRCICTRSRTRIRPAAIRDPLSSRQCVSAFHPHSPQTNGCTWAAQVR